MIIPTINMRCEIFINKENGKKITTRELQLELTFLQDCYGKYREFDDVDDYIEMLIEEKTIERELYYYGSSRNIKI